jgi:uncharacterized protein YkwD
MRTTMRSMVAILCLLCLALLPVAESLAASLSEGGGAGTDDATAGTSGKGSYSFTDTERCFMRRINRARVKRGLRKLDADKQLGYVGRRHAKKMAAAQEVFHDTSIGDTVTRWRTLGQNSGKGAGCRSLFQAFMNSEAHRANVLGSWRYLGIGVSRANGYVYVQQIFESRSDPGNVYRTPKD